MADLFDYMDAPDAFAQDMANPENLFFIPPGEAFADLIAKQLMAETVDPPR